MSWAKHAIDTLSRGEEAQIRPKGSSMKGRVESGQLVTLKPFDPINYEVGDIVLVRVKGNVYLHLIKAIANGQFLIGNNRGRDNGWVGAAAIYGKAIKLED